MERAPLEKLREHNLSQQMGTVGHGGGKAAMGSGAPADSRGASPLLRKTSQRRTINVAVVLLATVVLATTCRSWRLLTLPPSQQPLSQVRLPPAAQSALFANQSGGNSSSTNPPVSVFALPHSAFAASANATAISGISGKAKAAPITTAAAKAGSVPLPTSRGGPPKPVPAPGTGHADDASEALAEKRASATPPPSLACKPANKFDFDVVACDQGCSATAAKFHCNMCKCRSCAFCAIVGETTTGATAGATAGASAQPLTQAAGERLAAALEAPLPTSAHAGTKAAAKVSAHTAASTGSFGSHGAKNVTSVATPRPSASKSAPPSTARPSSGSPRGMPPDPMVSKPTGGAGKAGKSRSGSA